MALDTYSSIVGKVLLRCPMAGPLLARDWVTNAFRAVAERREWSWLQKQGQFVLSDVYKTGLVTTTQYSTTIVGNGTNFTQGLVGRQFRLVFTNPLYTITAVTDATHLTIDLPWSTATVTDHSYEIYTAYVSPPEDFHHFITVWDPRFNWQLHTSITQRELNNWDAQRSNRGQAYLVASRDYYTPVGQTAPLPRFEVWPHVLMNYVLPFIYISRADDIQDSGSTIPRYVRGDVLLELAMADCARWPGPSTDKVNPYFNLNLAAMHSAKAEYALVELERQDEEINMTRVWYDSVSRLPYSPLPLDASYWQSHAI